MDVIVNTVRMRLTQKSRSYIGNMTGLEFTARASETPKSKKKKKIVIIV